MGDVTMKAVLKSCTALALALSMSGQAFAQLKEIGPAEGQVTIIAWPGYIERGETDKAYDWVTKFEEASGCKVNVKTANTSDEMVALMNEGGFDLVTASGAWSPASASSRSTSTSSRAGGPSTTG
jgi:putative spermidine/putrescine transport system substrate-binding protein